MVDPVQVYVDPTHCHKWQQLRRADTQSRTSPEHPHGSLHQLQLTGIIFTIQLTHPPQIGLAEISELSLYVETVCGQSSLQRSECLMPS